CQFTLGRQAFTRKDYRQAAVHWQWTVNQTAETITEKRIVSAADGTLGFLYYRGLRVDENREKAIELFREGVKHGDLESRLFLGRVYSDDRNSIYDPITAYAWFKSVENFYRSVLDEQRSLDILDEAKHAVELLRGFLTATEIARGEEMSWT